MNDLERKIVNLRRRLRRYDPTLPDEYDGNAWAALERTSGDPTPGPGRSLDGQRCAVYLSSWWAMQDGRQAEVVVGTVAFVQAEELTGGVKTRGDQGWGLLIEGPTEKLFVFGCQIKGVAPITLTEHATFASAYKLR